jgi:hypothetical protein
MTNRRPTTAIREMRMERSGISRALHLSGRRRRRFGEGTLRFGLTTRYARLSSSGQPATRPALAAHRCGLVSSQGHRADNRAAAVVDCAAPAFVDKQLVDRSQRSGVCGAFDVIKPYPFESIGVPEARARPRRDVAPAHIQARGRSSRCDIGSEQGAEPGLCVALGNPAVGHTAGQPDVELDVVPR